MNLINDIKINISSLAPPVQESCMFAGLFASVVLSCPSFPGPTAFIGSIEAISESSPNLRSEIF